MTCKLPWVLLTGVGAYTLLRREALRGAVAPPCAAARGGNGHPDRSGRLDSRLGYHVR